MNYPESLGAWVKRAIVFAALRGVLPARIATTVIRALGVAHA